FRPEALRRLLSVGLVLLGAVTVLAVPFLGRFGARASNPTLLDRNYVGGYLAIAALVLICVVVASVVRARRSADATASGQ
ncbi:MAG: hypothetical protein ACR2FV_11935, partial [Ornithinimicrobium sp.]|uniref:hypothetical protein n=1 Tax=Ornithinimicrobium sp. TaxID=1977084 RepID=UPI003D9B0EC4